MGNNRPKLEHLFFYHSLVSNGYAFNSSGGGIFIQNQNSIQDKEIHFNNVIFQNNIAQYAGGGLFLDNSDNLKLKFWNCKFTNNTSITRGGGGFNVQSNNSELELNFNECDFIANYGGNNGSVAQLFTNTTTSIVTFIAEKCRFYHNTTSYGAALNLAYIKGNHNNVFNNCLFYGNYSEGFEKYDIKLDGIYETSITNCTFLNSENYSLSFYGNTDAISDVILANNIIWGNQQTIFNYNNDIQIYNCIIQNDCPIGSNCTNISSDNPLFTDAANFDFTVSTNSPAINAGNNTYIPEGITTDLVGNPRIANNTVDIGAYENNAPLSTVNLSFFAKQEQETVLLHWRTTSETQNKGFHIQKSPNGKTWQNIGWRDGQGTTNQTTHYQFTDEKPFKGINYYRLNHIETNGNPTFSNIQVVWMNKEERGILIFPNPTKDIVQVVNPSGKKLNALHLYDVQGRLIQAFSTNNREMTIHLKEYPSGVYFLKMKNDSKVFTQKIIKQ